MCWIIICMWLTNTFHWIYLHFDASMYPWILVLLHFWFSFMSSASFFVWALCLRLYFQYLWQIQPTVLYWNLEELNKVEASKFSYTVHMSYICTSLYSYLYFDNWASEHLFTVIDCVSLSMCIMWANCERASSKCYLTHLSIDELWWKVGLARVDEVERVFFWHCF